MKAKTRLLLREVSQYLSLALGVKHAAQRGPVEASLFLTRRCNSRCSMCEYWRNPESKASEQTLTEIEDLLDQLKDMGVVVISLSGEGEITLRDDLPEILRAVAKRGFLFSVNTNLLRIRDDQIEALLETQPYQLTVGIDSFNDAIYEQIRGIAGGAQTVASNIEALRERGYESIVLGTVVLHNNLSDLRRLVRFSVDKALAGVRFTAFQPYGFAKKWTSSQISLYRSPDYQAGLKRMVQDLVDHKRRHPGLILNSRTYLRLIPNSYAIAGFFPVRCRIPRRRIHIHPNGDVSLCQVMQERSRIGNVREDAIQSIWKGQKAKEVRALVDRKGCGGCWLSCYAETNLRFSAGYGWSAQSNAVRRLIRTRG